MPTLSSKVSHVAEKENRHPTSSRIAKQSNRYVSKFDDENDGFGERQDQIADLKTSSSYANGKEYGKSAKDRNSSSSSSSRLPVREQKESAEIDAIEKKRQAFKMSDKTSDEERDAEAASTSRPKRHRSDPTVRELADVQKQLDELRELRTTEPERMLIEWKVLAEKRDRQAEEYIATLEKQLHEEKLKSNVAAPARAALGAQVSSDDTNLRQTKEQIHELEMDLRNSQRLESSLRQENARLMRELERQKDLASKMPAASMPGSVPRNGTMQAEKMHERAIRRLYEDLTGIVIHNVEASDRSQDFRVFRGIFACPGYLDLEIKLEESSSDLPPTVPGASSGPRDDLVFTPIFKAGRDDELLQSGRLRQLQDPIRFERSTSAKFLSMLLKRLDRSQKLR